MTTKLEMIKGKGKTYLVYDFPAGFCQNPGQEVSRLVLGYIDGETTTIEDDKGKKINCQKLKV